MWRILAILAFFIFLATPDVQAAEKTPDSKFSCNNPYIFDGDTIACGDIRIRLASIDAPEMPDHCAPGKHCVAGNPFAARDYLQQLTTGNVTCRAVDKDKYGRTVAYCEVDGKDLSCEMVKAGHAVERYGSLDCTPALRRDT